MLASVPVQRNVFGDRFFGATLIFKKINIVVKASQLPRRFLIERALTITCFSRRAPYFPQLEARQKVRLVLPFDFVWGGL